LLKSNPGGETLTYDDYQIVMPNTSLEVDGTPIEFINVPLNAWKKCLSSINQPNTITKSDNFINIIKITMPGVGACK
jgi:hypothetical protein